MTTLIVEVDQRQAEAALKKLNTAIGQTGKKADDSFGKARDELGRFIATGEKGGSTLKKGFGGLSGSIIGLSSPLKAATIGVAALSAAFVALAAVATKAFIDITKEGVNLNKEAELTKLSLTAIFEGNEKAAQGFIEDIGELAIRLGTSRQELTGLAKGILPDVGSVKGTTALLENVIVLGRDAGQGIESIRIATEEALSGNLTSLGRRLNIPKKTLDSIREYQKEMSLADAINRGLSERILETGISADVTADSFTTLQGKISGTIENFKLLEGEAPFEELKEQARDFIEILDTQGEDIGFVAEAFGDLAANVIDFVGSGLTEFISSIDFEAVERLVDSFNLALSAGQLVLDVLFELPDTEAGINQTTVALIKVQGALELIAKLAAKAKIALQSTVILSKAGFQFATKDFQGAIETLKEIGDVVSLENQAEAAENTASAFERYEERIKGISEANKERRDTSDDATDADREAGDALLANKKATEELQSAQADAAEAQEVISKKQADLEEDRQKRLTDIARKEGQKRFDDEVKNAQKREDIARNNAEALEDIIRKQGQSIADAGKDLTREEQDIALKGARERQQVERDSAQARIDVERDFRQQLQDIQRQFNQSAQDAERNNDAQAFLQAVRARDEQIDVAKSDRNESLGDVDRGAQQKREELKTQLAQEVEDSKTANARKLEDLQVRLAQEFEAQAIKNERDIEQQALQEQRQQEQRDLAAQRELETFERSQAEKEAKLNESLEKQFALIEAAKEKEIALVAKAEAEKTKIVAEEMARRAKALREAEEESAQTSLPPLAAGINRGGGLTPMAAGGDLAAGQSAIVGEGGPEVFTAPVGGRIIPNQTMFSPPGSPLGAGASINNSRSLNVEQMGINPGDGILSRMVQNEMSKMLQLLG